MTITTNSRSRILHCRATASVLLVVSSLVSLLGNIGLAQNRTEAPAPNRQVVYKTVGKRTLQLDVFEPKVKDASKSRPAIVFFFGGGWTSGTTEQFHAQARHLADRGMVAFCADYRVKSRDSVPAVECVADAQDAMLYVRDHAGDWNIDPNRIAAAGGSAGGHLAAACATVKYCGKQADVGQRFRPSALVLFNPALVLHNVDEATLKAEGLELSPSQLAQSKLEGMEQRLGVEPATLSPLAQLNSTLPATLILHGKADTTVPYWTVDLFARRAKKLGADCTLVGYADQKHGFFNYKRDQKQYTATRDEMTSFLSRLGWIEKA